jgi:hypothetical protein
MSQDIFFRKIRRNWARGTATPTVAAQPLPLTEKERLRIERLAQLDMRATNGDITAQKQIIKINTALAVLQRKAKRGDANAARILFTLKESGLVQQIAASSKKTTPKLAVAGTSIGFNSHWNYIHGLGEEEIALAMEGGQCERDALVRRFSPSDMGRRRQTPPRRQSRKTSPERQAVIDALQPWNGKSIKSDSVLRKLIQVLTPLAEQGNEYAKWQVEVYRRTLQRPESQR